MLTVEQGIVNVLVIRAYDNWAEHILACESCRMNDVPTRYCATGYNLKRFLQLTLPELSA